MKELSIFIDESGDFGAYAPHCPYYIVALVFHEQSAQIADQTTQLEGKLSYLGMPSNHCFHTMPLIRRESDYHAMDVHERSKLLNILAGFMRSLPIRFMTFILRKNDSMSVIGMTQALSRQLASFITMHYEYLSSFDKVIVYYDNGQTELTKIIVGVFTALLPSVDFRRVEPSNYRLFQVADYCCTMELLRLKLDSKTLSNSELHFFGNTGSLRKDFLSGFDRKRMKE